MRPEIEEDIPYTPTEVKLTEFEEKLYLICNELFMRDFAIDRCGYQIKEWSAELMAIARKQINEEMADKILTNKLINQTN